MPLCSWCVCDLQTRQGNLPASHWDLVPDTESVGALLPVQNDSSRLVFDPDPPGGILGLLAAIAVHSLGGAVWEFPPLEPGCVDFLLSIAEHDDFVSIPVEQKH